MFATKLCVFLLICWCFYQYLDAAVYPNTCCKVKDSVLHTKKVQQMDCLFEFCRVHLQIPKNSKSRTTEQTNCLDECISRRLGITDMRNKMDYTGFKEHVTNNMALTSFQKAAACKASMKCYYQVNAIFGAANTTSNNGTEVCTRIGMEGIYCAEKELFKSCPVNLRNTTEKCQELRKSVT